jgi:hypothetical protein
MNAISSQVPPSLMAELTMFLRTSGNPLLPGQAASLAIRAWIQAQQQPASAGAAATAPASGRGYQWKDLFLPEGTELRMSTLRATSQGATCYARVEGDHIIFRGNAVSPRGMTLAIAGEGRNAWRDLWLKFPGEPRFVPAIRCRREQARAANLPVVPAAPEPFTAASGPTPADSLNAAALTMAEALKTTLALMARASAQAMPEHERRVTAARRGSDILAGECAFD